MEKYTSGPWEVHHTTYHPHIHIYTNDVLNPDCICSMDGHKGEKDDANARLIASAPDMLEALKFCLEFLTSPALTDPDCEVWKSVLIESAKIRANVIKAAIAKAEGGGR